MNNNKNVGEVISNYFSINRQSFEEFYPSERKTIEFVVNAFCLQKTNQSFSQQ